LILVTRTVGDKTAVSRPINTWRSSYTAVLIDLRDAEVEGTVILLNVRNFLPTDRDTFQETCLQQHCCENLKSRKYHKLHFSLLPSFPME